MSPLTDRGAGRAARDVELPEETTWIRVVGMLDTVEAGRADEPEPLPVLVVSSYSEIDEPDEPYEVPASRVR